MGGRDEKKKKKKTRLNSNSMPAARRKTFPSIVEVVMKARGRVMVTPS